MISTEFFYENEYDVCMELLGVLLSIFNIYVMKYMYIFQITIIYLFYVHIYNICGFIYKHLGQNYTELYFFREHTIYILCDFTVMSENSENLQKDIHFQCLLEMKVDI